MIYWNISLHDKIIFMVGHEDSFCLYVPIYDRDFVLSKQQNNAFIISYVRKSLDSENGSECVMQCTASIRSHPFYIGRVFAYNSVVLLSGPRRSILLRSILVCAIILRM